MCHFEATIYIAVGSTRGSVQIEYEVSGPTTATVAAGSTIAVLQTG